MTDHLRRACLVAASIWALLHVVLCFLYWGEVAKPAVAVAALIAFIAALALAARPLTRPGFVEAPWVQWAITLAPPVVQAINLAAIPAADVRTFANWAQGATCLFIAALVMRSRLLLALLAAAGQVGVQAWFLAMPGVDSSPADYLLAAVSSQLWLIASWGVRRLLNSAGQLTVRLEDRAALASIDTAVTAEWQRVRAERAADLEHRVLPMLEQVAAGQLSDEAARDHATELATELRDDLRARNLLDAETRRAIADARHRGVQINLASDVRTPAVVARRARTALLVALPLPGVD
ncbi:MAG: hypothetical protein WAW88_07980, partial [Nocardioides sp.]